jgi:serine/threonine protein phosphatase PrpC
VIPSSTMRLTYVGTSDVGRKRTHNEDAYLLLPEESLFCVADGMGGHASGEVASRLAVEIINDHFAETGKQQTLTWPYKVDRDLRTHINRMTTGIMMANLEIWERAQREPRFKGMGTTCVACYFLDDALVDYIRMKRVTPEEAENWPHKNVIVRALGMKESVQVDILTEKPQLGDTYLLCSDGLTGMIKNDQMQHILMIERDLDRAVDRLIDAANEEGGVDNISVVLARIESA